MEIIEKFEFAIIPNKYNNTLDNFIYSLDKGFLD